MVDAALNISISSTRSRVEAGLQTETGIRTKALNIHAPTHSDVALCAESRSSRLLPDISWVRVPGRGSGAAVPEVAVSSDQAGRYVLTVQCRCRRRAVACVQLGQTTGEMRVSKSGLPDERSRVRHRGAVPSEVIRSSRPEVRAADRPDRIMVPHDFESSSPGFGNVLAVLMIVDRRVPLFRLPWRNIQRVPDDLMTARYPGPGLALCRHRRLPIEQPGQRRRRMILSVLQAPTALYAQRHFQDRDRHSNFL